MMRGDQTTTRASVLDSAYDYLIVAIVSVVVVIGGGVWAIGQLAGLLFRGAWPPVSFTQALAAVFARKAVFPHRTLPAAGRQSHWPISETPR